MNRRHPALLAAGLLLPALLAGCTGSGDGTDARDAAAPLPSVSLPAPRRAPAPAAVLATPVRGGEVRVEDGPFTDRVKFSGLKLGRGASVTGHLAITSDVSDVLALELRAAFYDDGGHLLGSGTLQYQEEDPAGGHSAGPRAEGDGIDVTVTADGVTGTPAGAVLSLPVLVNE